MSMTPEENDLMNDDFGVEDYAQKQDLIEATDAVEKALEMPEGLQEVIDDEEPSEPEIRNFAELKSARLSRQIIVMDLEFENANGVSFSHKDDDTGKTKTSLGMSRDDWEDFGKPEKISVKVYPRDILNEL